MPRGLTDLEMKRLQLKKALFYDHHQKLYYSPQLRGIWMGCKLQLQLQLAIVDSFRPKVIPSKAF